MTGLTGGSYCLTRIHSFCGNEDRCVFTMTLTFASESTARCATVAFEDEDMRANLKWDVAG